uniref:Uncharacterized protein n=1 Tax=Anas zonorhyncha TaxID=75864 RepID=A0A8B9V3Q7_9AVES
MFQAGFKNDKLNNLTVKHTSQTEVVTCRSDRGIFGAVAKGCLSEIEKTLKDNDINALNSSRETLLHVAAANGHLAVMEYLISRGAKPDVKDKKGRTPLHRAAEKGHGDAVKVLLRCGTSMYSLDTEGKMPLHVVAQHSHGHYSKDLPSNLMESALFKAVQKNLHDIVAVLYTPLLLACETGKAESAEVLIEKGASLVLLSSGHYWALHQCSILAWTLFGRMLYPIL